MFAKVAEAGSFVSNIARGGEAMNSASVLNQVFTGETAARISMSVMALSLTIARELAQSLPGLADIGLDIGVTRDKKIYFIECNARDQRYGFQKAGLGITWKESYRRPMGFARYLLENPSQYNGY
jgi:glutathione synthase/RimK-type ligase-like ATP-grasp enzyme